MNKYLNNLMTQNYSPYLIFDRAAWCEYKRDMPFELTEEDITLLHGHYETISLKEVIDVYLPLSRLLDLYVKAAQELFQVTGQFLGHPEPKVPYIIGISGSVAVGKSTTSRVLQALLSTWSNHPNVAIVTTDGFIYPNAELEHKNLMHRKGFPESYNLRMLINFLTDLKAGKPLLEVPIYSHEYYDITKEVQTIEKPDIVIIEGLNLLQHNVSANQKSQVFVTDYIDFSIYVDAPTTVIEQWYLDRFMKFRAESVARPELFMHRFSMMNDQEALSYAKLIWKEINELNLQQNILPYKDRAKLILCKGYDHLVEKVLLRKI
jgi:type I pantothenate kinase